MTIEYRGFIIKQTNDDCGHEFFEAILQEKDIVLSNASLECLKIQIDSLSSEVNHV